ncbi:MAG TPA: amino acid adenylation domain-containing protein [Nitrospirota bacterium]|nr:amino acid adenylation domain-containing protein [Nitrospirota bacterium]
MNIEKWTDNDAPMNSLSLQHENEYQSLVIEYNKSAAPYPTDKTIIELFEAQVERSPDDEAIRLGDRRLTYRELNGRVNQMTAKLCSLGIERGNLVALFMEHSIEVVCSILGVLKAGAAYVPIDIATPKERIAFILEDISKGLAGKMPVVVTQSSFAGSLPNGKAQVVTLDADFVSISEYPVSNPRSHVSPDTLAYIIFTSGSTGVPKGVMIEHRSLVNYIWWANKMYCKGERLSWPLFSSLAFDLTVTSIFTPLISGGRIVVYREDHGLHGTVIFKVIEDNAADIVKLTPSHLAMIKDIITSTSRIRKFIVGGEDFKTELASEITHNLGNPVEIYNEYGPTETTVGCMIHRYDSEKDFAISVPIGIPAANTCIFILDENLSPVPIGVIGEMYIAGDGLARGYFNRPALTAEKFLTTADPRQNGSHEKSVVFKPGLLRLYKTGDVARWNANGSMEFLGRADNQVKVGGMRIELGEIEACLMKHGDVRECVVDVYKLDGKQISEMNDDMEAEKTGETNLTRLVAYYVSDKSLKATELRAHLLRELPAYMVPPYFVLLDKLPITTNGKIDRKALPSPTSDSLATSHDFVGPQTETTKALAAIWTELLNVENIGINDDFFELGGHSLLALKAVSRIRDVFKVDLPAETMFEKPTIASLSGILAAQLDKTASSQALPPKHESIGVAIPMVEPFYFDSGEDRLFGILHRPKTMNDKNIGVLFCAPIVHEYLRTHRILRQIAVALSELGHYVLRFDYTGCGDSSGENLLGGVKKWAEDAYTAEKELKVRSGVKRTIVLATRFGAPIAAKANINAPLVLWDPVENGAEYLKELELLTEAVRKENLSPERRSNTNELVGFAIPPELRAEIMNIDLTQLLGDVDPKPKTIKSSEYSSAVSWNNAKNWTNAVLSGEVVKAIVDTIQGLTFSGRGLQ